MATLVNDSVVNLCDAAGSLTGPMTARQIAAASGGDGEACHALGLAYASLGTRERDLVEAHKWFNLGALYGCEEAAWSRSDIAAEMTKNEIAEAQRRAREWLGADMRRAA